MTEPKRMNIDKVLTDLQYHLETSKVLLSCLEEAGLSQLLHNSLVRTKNELTAVQHTVDLVCSAIERDPPIMSFEPQVIALTLPDVSATSSPNLLTQKNPIVLHPTPLAVLPTVSGFALEGDREQHQLFG